jgi:hypothetical protein
MMIVRSGAYALMPFSDPKVVGLSVAHPKVRLLPQPAFATRIFVVEESHGSTPVTHTVPVPVIDTEFDVAADPAVTVTFPQPAVAFSD